MWRLLWRVLTRALRQEQGAIVVWWLQGTAQDAVAEALQAYGLAHLLRVVFVHERMYLTTFVDGYRPKGPRFFIGFKTLVVS